MSTNSKNRVNNIAFTMNNYNNTHYKNNNSEVIILEKFSDVSRAKKIAENLGISYYAVQALLTDKKFKTLTQAEIEAMFSPDLSVKHPVEGYAETKKAIKEIKDAISSGENIGIYGDYDGDGVTSALILGETLSDLVDKNRLHYEFSRVKEDGFDFSEYGLEQLADKGCKTIIVLDTGSNSVDALKKAAEMGIKCIVIDHHEFNDDTEKIDEVTYVNPHLYPAKSNENELKNAGLAWYFSRALYNELLGNEPEKLYKETLGYAALGTVADAGSQLEGPYNAALLHNGFSPDVLENIDGLSLLSQNMHTLDDTSDKKTVTAIQILSLGKRISSVKPAEVFTLLSNSSAKEEKEQIMEKLLTKHSESNTVAQTVSESIAELYNNNKENVVIEAASSEDVPAEFIGNTGVIANRVSRATGKPAFVFVKNDDGSYKGSFRMGTSKMKGIEVLQRLSEKYPDVVASYGGHSVAGGINIENKEKLNAFKELMKKFVDYQVKHEPGYVSTVPKKSKENNAKNKIFSTVLIPNDEINSKNLSDVLRLAPFSGFAVKSPRFYSKGLTFAGKKNGKLVFKNDKGKNLQMIPNSDLELETMNLQKGSTVDMVFSVFRDKGNDVGYTVNDILTQ